jgi:hypothetical protein
MSLSLQIRHFEAPASYPIAGEADPTLHAFRRTRTSPIAYGTEPTNHAFHGTGTIPYKLSGKPFRSRISWHAY